MGYVAVGLFLAAALAVSIGIGSGRHASPPIGGFYSSTSACLGNSFKLAQSGQFVDLSGGVTGKLRFQDGHLTGTVNCASGGTAHADLAVTGTGSSAMLAGTVGSSQATAKFHAPLPPPGVSTAKVPKRSSEQTFGRLMLAIAAVLLAARAVGAATNRLSQPRVMGEVLAGILLGPTLLGAVWPEAQAYLFPADIVPLLIGRCPDRPRLLPVPGRDGDRPAASCAADRPGGVPLQHQRRVPARARLPRRDPDLPAAGARRSLPAVRALHGRRDVDHGVPGARADPDRAAHAQAPGRRARDGGRGGRRRHRVGAARAGDRGRRHRQGDARAPGDRSSPRSSSRRCC